MGFPGGSVVRSLPANAGDPGLIPGQEDPLEEEMEIYSSILAWEIPGTGSLKGYNPWGHKESGTTERPSTHLSREDTSAAPDGPLTVNSKHFGGLPGQQGWSSCGGFSPRIPGASHWRSTYTYQKGPQGLHDTTCQTRGLGLDTGDFISIS